MKQFYAKATLKELIKQHWMEENSVNKSDLSSIIVKERPGGFEVIAVLKKEGD